MFSVSTGEGTGPGLKSFVSWYFDSICSLHKNTDINTVDVHRVHLLHGSTVCGALTGKTIAFFEVISFTLLTFKVIILVSKSQEKIH
jgi:hypothetical protein